METDDEDAFWDYKSLKRRRKQGDSQETQQSPENPSQSSRTQRLSRGKNKAKSRAAVPKSSQATKQKSPGGKSGKNSYKKLTPVRERVRHEGYCPFCQMPFCLLIVDTPRSHIAECMDLSITATLECSAGSECDVTIESHYRYFKHSDLARMRSGCNNDRRSDAGSGHGSKGSSVTQDGGEEAKNGEIRHSQTAHRSLSSTNETATETQFESRTCSSSTNDESPAHSHLANSGTRKTCKKQLDYSNENGENKANAVMEAKKIKPVLSTVNFEDAEPRSISDMLEDALDSESDIFKSDDESTQVCSIRKNRTDFNEDSCQFMEFTQDQVEEVNVRPNTNMQIGNNRTDHFCIQTHQDQGSLQGEDLQLSQNRQFHFTRSSLNTSSERNQLSSKGDITIELSSLSDPSDDENHTKETCMPTRQTDNNKNLQTTSPVVATSQQVRLLQKRPSSQSSQHASTSTAKSQISCTSTQPSIFSFFKALNPVKWNRNTGQKVANGFTAITSKLPGMSKNNENVPHSSSNINLRSTRGDKPSAKVVDSSVVSNLPVKTAPVTSGFNSGNDCASLSTTGGRYQKRPCPFYKKMPGTPFTVDAFRYGSVPGCTAYFLTHFHYDHYGGLTKKFHHPIYCSQATGNLVKSKLYVRSEYIKTVPLNVPTMIAGVEVTFMEANHCPGAVIILFKLKDGTNILHTGDFRAHTSMEQYTPLLENKIQSLYLDTTYCNPTYTFPEQREVIELAVSLAVDAVTRNPDTLIVCGSYTIGKEKVFTAIADALGCKIAVNRDKKRVLDCLDDDHLSSMVTLQWTASRLHVLPMGSLNLKNLQEHLENHGQYSGLLAFEPTGWTHSNKALSLHHIKPKVSRNGITVYGIPYSEHSSYLEMKRFVQFIRPDKILATVNNGNPQSRKKMDDIFKSWMEENSSPSKRKLTKQQTMINSWLQASQQ